MKLDPAIILWTLAISIPLAVVIFIVMHNSQKRKKARDERLWETGATILLGKVFGLSNEPNPGDKPVIGEPAHVTRRKIAAHIKESDYSDRSFEGTVCGEEVRVVLRYPNILFGFVDKAETLRAITEAHSAMTSSDEQTFIGISPLKLDIRLTS